MANLAALFLAAGQQTRFRAAHLKCLSDIGGKPLIQHSAAVWKDHDLYIVVSSLWRPDEVAFVEKLGFTAIRSGGRTIGMSLHDGLAICEPHEYSEIAVVAADTFFVDGTIPFSPLMAIFDPRAWVTLWTLRPWDEQQKPDTYSNMKDRVDYMTSGDGMFISLVSWNWINVNTVDDLERARRLWRDTSE